MPPWSHRAALAICVGLAVALRLQAFEQLDVRLTVPFGRPWVRPPLLDAVAFALGPLRNGAAWVAGALTVLATDRLLRNVLPVPGRIAAAAAAAVCPALVLAHGFWSERALTIPLVLVTATLLAESLRGRGQPAALTGVATLALLADWTAWPPVLAWLGWLTVFRPAWVPDDRLLPARRALVLAVAIALPVYAGVVAVEGDPSPRLGATGMPTGLEAAARLVGALAGLWLGLVREHCLALRIGVAGAVVAAWGFGAQRAAATGHREWGGVLLVGTAGSLVPALALHPWIPVAADKNLWALAPLTIALAAVALWPRRAVAAAVLLVGCTDADGDGAWAEFGDCDDEDAAIYPDAPELWDGIDNDCDGAVDVSDDYRFWTDDEPNDTSIGGCWAPDGQDVGILAPMGMLNRIDGRIDEVVDQSYEEGDFDCFALRMPATDAPARLTLELSWPGESDLDLALWGLWGGEQRGFVQGDAAGPGPERHISSAALPGNTALWLWLGGYSGEPTDYRIDLIVVADE